jgi:Holliday junction DNA helicase RuvA
MIGKLNGRIDSVNEDNCILDVNGVGYVVYCPSRILLSLQLGQSKSLVTHLLVKEDQLTLFGFNDKEEKDCFLNLQTVQGVGAKMALSVLNALSPAKISLALLSDDESAFKQISGIGSKLASRIINELKGKAHLFSSSETNFSPSQANCKNDASILADALSALSNLGFSKSETYPIINKLYADNENIAFDDLLRHTLAQLSKQK